MQNNNLRNEKIIIAATGASGMPILQECLHIIRQTPGYESVLIMSRSAVLTMEQEMECTREEMEKLVDHIYSPEEIGAGPASGSYRTAGMIIVPCSMKTVAGICGGYADNLILRAADVTIKEQRPLVLEARETPLSPIHLRNMYELSRMPGVRIIPPMLTFYQKPECIEDMVHHIAARLVEPFGIEAEGYRRWDGI
ncbi:UbiX family flavin prenyltransferase [Lachnoclostridium sp. An118]|uniref:UbiX family flavin prenyltransferase n=1 Tax=Lachnoclostridium sp. An118 TaxID=1965547 RepID=UPI000B3AEA56|nr:UbiX family flavin prenyltransferase [Lachnoclostridium sp. An118]OUQ49215.1 aromatic acid decarboxylase [Lachnoclostridium sp. An118]